jgi:hypothetical protein
MGQTQKNTGGWEGVPMQANVEQNTKTQGGGRELIEQNTGHSSSSSSSNRNRKPGTKNKEGIWVWSWVQKNAGCRRRLSSDQRSTDWVVNLSWCCRFGSAWLVGGCGGMARFQQNQLAAPARGVGGGGGGVKATSSDFGKLPQNEVGVFLWFFFCAFPSKETCTNPFQKLFTKN